MKTNNNDWLLEILKDFEVWEHQYTDGQQKHIQVQPEKAIQAILSAIKDRFPKKKKSLDRKIGLVAPSATFHARCDGYDQAIEDTLKALGIE